MLRLLAAESPRATATIAFVCVAASALGTTVSFVPDAAVFGGDTEQTVEVVVDGVEDLLGFSFAVGYDPDVVTPVAVAPGSLLQDAPCTFFFQGGPAEDDPTVILADGAMLGCTLSDGGSLVTLTFAGAGAGTSPLTLLVADLRNGQNEPIAVETTDGALTYVPEVTAMLTFAPEMVYFDEDGTGEVCLTLAGVPEFRGMSVVFGFDPAVIAPVSVAAGEILEGAACPYFLDWINQDGWTDTMAVDAALLGCDVAADGTVICVTFQGVGYGESPLPWLEVEVRDGNNDPVLVEAIDGSILYDPAVAVEPTNLSEVKANFWR